MDPNPGILSEQLMVMLKTSKIDFIPVLPLLPLSPSFYMPHNLLLLTDPEFIHLAASFNSLEAWTLLSQYSERCQEYFKQPRSKPEYFLFTKALLERGDQESAKNFLAKTLQFEWPETYRYYTRHNM